MSTKYSERTESLLQNLAGTTELSLSQILAPGHAVILIGSAVVGVPQAQLMASFLINLAARLFPVVQRLTIVIPRDVDLAVAVPRWSAPSFAAHLRAILSALPQTVKWEITAAVPAGGDCALSIGEADGHTNVPTLAIGSDGWEAYFSPGPKGATVGHNENPVGAYAAACIGVSEIWKRLLAKHPERFSKVVIRPQLEPLTFSTLTYQASPGPNPALPDKIDIGRLTIAGVGAGGGATVYTLASLRELAGRVNLIDPDAIEATNLNRYVIADATDAASEAPKVDISADLLSRFPAVETRRYAESFSNCSGLSEDDYQYVVAAVHSREARRDIQMETPGVLWDAGATQDGEFRIWRMILGKTECMYCKHPPGEDDPEYKKAEQIAKLLRLDRDLCLRKIKNHEPFTEAEAASIATLIYENGYEFAAPRPGQRFNDWEQEQCGKLALPEVDHEVPIPFAPVMAGVLLAGEVVKQRCFPEHTLDSRYSNTLKGKFMVRSRPFRRTPRESCSFCHDPIYLSQHARRWK